ncbi:hypothetical protein Rxyl_3021 [Rubrobacter xylanophilus DSM 9941]|uniref:HMA domain-containing protein n=1 Tax=Rubrobacter xylanophilus (strain DSM 9941 / JCM 11954 / NBRC 16129 / PRD-1) TaxID=266117 RepID=Q1ARP7_RUBXD|nr:heavy-metal-associated domain-containing protein [Rubrobacter xylanophilus]ABG05931.1 hypothetical protein Rxyl_3021 [Rubrobacter xylanophilus DSM 9941]
MPDITLVMEEPGREGGEERLERALRRLEQVRRVNVDRERGLVAVSYEGGGEELARIEEAARRAGYRVAPSPGAREVGGEAT